MSRKMCSLARIAPVYGSVLRAMECIAMLQLRKPASEAIHVVILAHKVCSTTLSRVQRRKRSCLN